MNIHVRSSYVGIVLLCPCLLVTSLAFGADNDTANEKPLVKTPNRAVLYPRFPDGREAADAPSCGVDILLIAAPCA